MGADDLVGDDRASGHRVRSTIDCPIAERHEARLLHADGDLVHIASPCRRSMRRMCEPQRMPNAT